MPEPAPLVETTSRLIDALLQREEDQDLDTTLQRANRDYLYWDKLKQLPPPPGFSTEEVWGVLKLSRTLNRRRTPIRDTHGHRFWYSLTDELQRALMVIDQQAGGRIGASVPGISQDVQRTYLTSRLMEEAIASSQIEGAATTRRDAKEMLRTGRPPKTRGERMILNNFKTITRARELMAEELTPMLLLELQASLTEGTLDDPSEEGRFRGPRDDNVVVGDGFGHVVHIPPPPPEISGELEALCRFANEDGDQFFHPVLKAVLLHFWLAYLHPFCDGNGRTARALFYLHALKHGYWLFEYVSISRVILRSRAKYESAFLYSEVDDADVTYFATFHLHAIELALTEFWGYVERKADEDRALQQHVAQDEELNYRQRAILSRALKDSTTRFTIQSHRSSHNIAYGTARSDLLGLVERGYLAQRRDGRGFVFHTVRDLRDRLAKVEASARD
jgi:Fic family protein